MRGAWIQQYGGKQFHFLDPQPGEFDIEAIAHHLANVNRFTGAARRPYSVAEHSVHVSLRAEAIAAGHPPAYVLTCARWGLIHDASEAFLNDISSPLKGLEAMAGYRAIEKRIMEWICEALSLQDGMPPEVKRADEQVFFTEAEQLMAPLRPEWRAEYGDRWAPIPGVPPESYGLGWREARTLFLTRFNGLFGGGK